MNDPAHRRKAANENRDDALLRAALVVFADAGLRDGRIDDIAAMAGVSKGAVYLSFPTKVALFRAAVRLAITSYSHERSEMRRALVQIMIRDGVHFPDLIECCHRELLAPRLAAIRASVSSGDCPENSPFMRFPHLVLAPQCFALIWNALFEAIDPLNEEEFETSFRHILLASLPLGGLAEGASDGA